MTDLIHRSTSEELADRDGLTREYVLRRLRDWRDRVHRLYDDMAQALKGSDLIPNREGKHKSSEEVPQRVGLTADDEPEIDILRIVRPDGTNAAIFLPRGLWVIGANGRIDLKVMPRVGSAEVYTLLDRSEAFGPANWVRMPIGSPFEPEPFSPTWLASKLR